MKSLSFMLRLVPHTVKNETISRTTIPMARVAMPKPERSKINSVRAISSIKRALSSDFVSSSILSCQILTAHAQPFRGARDLAFCLKVPLDSLLVWASSGGSGETARMRRLAWTFAARIGDKYQIRLTWPKRSLLNIVYVYMTKSY